RRTVKSAPQ
nr:RecName: Full=Chlorophyll a-b binding protein; AltName: Full=LHCII type II CAB; Short=LHCP [Spinacia oleracea]AAB19812.1 LHC II=light-harvesting chlorophyll protein II [Spinacia oleracea L.=spinach, Peptide Chloroplast Partial, 9 aa] [Spinacia oleracea]